jgi:S1-C subfamily serine protease
VIGGLGGVTQSVAATVAARQEFAGYWEYLLDEALFTYPSHPNWGGAPALSAQGELIGIGSLQIEREQAKGKTQQLNMIVPINLLKPVLGDLRTRGRPDRPPRPWLGIYTAEIEDRVVVVGIVPKGPASRAELKTGDVILRVGDERVSGTAAFYRQLWALGPAGVDVPLTLYREGDTFDVEVVSADRSRQLKSPRLH